MSNRKNKRNKPNSSNPHYSPLEEIGNKKGIRLSSKQIERLLIYSEYINEDLIPFNNSGIYFKSILSKTKDGYEYNKLLVNENGIKLIKKLKKEIPYKILKKWKI